MDFNREADQMKNLHFDFSLIKICQNDVQKSVLEEQSEDDSSEEILSQVSEAFGF